MVTIVRLLFDDEGSANTIFNMPGQDVTVTANYKPCFKPTIVLSSEVDNAEILEDESFDIDWEVENLGNEVATQEVKWTIILEERGKDGNEKHSVTDTDQLTIDAGATKTLDPYTVDTSDFETWGEVEGGVDVFTIKFETDCNDDVKRVFVEEPPELDFLCAICTSLQVDPGQNRIRLNLRNRAGNLIPDLDDKDEWEVFLPVGSPNIVSVSYDTPAWDFEIIVENIPVGTDREDVTVTYKGYEFPPGDIVITFETE